MGTPLAAAISHLSLSLDSLLLFPPSPSLPRLKYLSWLARASRRAGSVRSLFLPFIAIQCALRASTSQLRRKRRLAAGESTAVPKLHLYTRQPLISALNDYPTSFSSNKSTKLEKCAFLFRIVDRQLFFSRSCLQISSCLSSALPLRLFAPSRPFLLRLRTAPLSF